MRAETRRCLGPLQFILWARLERHRAPKSPKSLKGRPDPPDPIRDYAYDRRAGDRRRRACPAHRHMNIRVHDHTVEGPTLRRACSAPASASPSSAQPFPFPSRALGDGDGDDDRRRKSRSRSTAARRSVHHATIGSLLKTRARFYRAALRSLRVCRPHRYNLFLQAPKIVSFTSSVFFRAPRSTLWIAASQKSEYFLKDVRT